MDHRTAGAAPVAAPAGAPVVTVATAATTSACQGHPQWSLYVPNRAPDDSNGSPGPQPPAAATGAVAPCDVAIVIKVQTAEITVTVNPEGRGGAHIGVVDTALSTVTAPTATATATAPTHTPVTPAPVVPVTTGPISSPPHQNVAPRKRGRSKPQRAPPRRLLECHESDDEVEVLPSPKRQSVAPAATLPPRTMVAAASSSRPTSQTGRPKLHPHDLLWNALPEPDGKLLVDVTGTLHLSGATIYEMTLETYRTQLSAGNTQHDRRHMVATLLACFSFLRPTDEANSSDNGAGWYMLTVLETRTMLHGALKSKPKRTAPSKGIAPTVHDTTGQLPGPTTGPCAAAATISRAIVQPKILVGRLKAPPLSAPAASLLDHSDHSDGRPKVYCYMGSRSDQSVGNVAYRQMVQSMQPQFQQADSAARHTMVDEILQTFDFQRKVKTGWQSPTDKWLRNKLYLSLRQRDTKQPTQCNVDNYGDTSDAEGSNQRLVVSCYKGSQACKSEGNVAFRKAIQFYRPAFCDSDAGTRKSMIHKIMRRFVFIQKVEGQLENPTDDWIYNKVYTSLYRAPDAGKKPPPVVGTGDHEEDEDESDGDDEDESDGEDDDESDREEEDSNNNHSGGDGGDNLDDPSIVHCYQGSASCNLEGNVAYRQTICSSFQKFYSSDENARRSILDSIAERFQFRQRVSRGYTIPTDEWIRNKILMSLRHHHSQEQQRKAGPSTKPAAPAELLGGMPRHKLDSTAAANGTLVVYCGFKEDSDTAQPGNLAYKDQLQDASKEYCATTDEGQRQLIADALVERFQFVEPVNSRATMWAPASQEWVQSKVSRELALLCGGKEPDTNGSRSTVALLPDPVGSCQYVTQPYATDDPDDPSAWF